MISGKIYIVYYYTMNIPRNFSCPITKYSIEFVINNTSQVALLDMIHCDYKNIKALLSLLRTSIDKLQKENMKTIVQFVAFIEWDCYLKDKTTWQITNTDNINKVYTISCSIGDFLTNYGIGIGIL